MEKSQQLYVYILKGSDNSYHTGITNCPQIQLDSSSKTKKGPKPSVELAYYETFIDYDLAVTWEKIISGWSKRKKEELINGKWDVLEVLGHRQSQAA